jgi:beta-glucuronidase
MIRPQRNHARDFIDISGVWRIRFDPQDIGESQGWHRGIGSGAGVHAIAVPGSWNEQLAEAGYMNYVGAAWFETELFVPTHAGGKRLALRFGSADYAARVFADGVEVGASGPAHLPFEVELANANPGSRLKVVVRVDNRLPLDGPTQRLTRDDYITEGRPKDEYLPAVRFDFFPYGGLARPVYLTLTPRAGFDAVQVDTRIDGRDGVIAIEVEGRFESVASVRARIGEFSAEASPAKATARVELRVASCPRWSPRTPTLLPLRLEALSGDGALIDQIDLRIGVREVRVEGQKLLLNGEPIQLRGFGKHEDSVVRGRGLDLPLMVKDFELLRWTGANSVRTSHYPYAEEFYDFCDEQGILIVNETFSVNLDFRKTTTETLALHKQALSALIARDRNRACVIAWSLANEPGYLGEREYQHSGSYWSELFAHARALDSSRPLTHANVEYAGAEDPAYAHCDFISINRYYGWYKQPAQLDAAIERLNADFDRLAAHGKPLFVSEFGADALAGEHATYPQLFSEEYQADLIEAYWRAIEAHAALIGGHVWNFADFRTAQHGRRVVLNLKGVFTRDRRPEAAAFRVRELWRDKN